MFQALIGFSGVIHKRKIKKPFGKNYVSGRTKNILTLAIYRHFP